MFWGIEVSKTPVKFIPSFDLHITTACLTALAKDTGRNVLQVQYDGKTYSLCSLKLGAIEHSVLDTNFEEGKEIVFSVSGNNSICLTGYFVDSMYGGEEEEGEDEEDEEDEEEEGLEQGDEEEMEDDEDEEEDDDDEDEDEELENQILQQTLKRKAQLVAQSKQPEKKPKQEQAKPATPEKKAATPVKEQPKQVEQKKVATPEKKAATPVKEQPKQVVEKKPTKSIVTLPNGLQYEDIVVGNGVSPKSGKKVSVKYIGKLTNGKTFDSSLRTPFSFRIGIREVIRGWDIGVASMKVGGKRRLTIPADLAYGRAGAPPSIPPNATLIFDVELVSCAQ